MERLYFQVLSKTGGLSVVIVVFLLAFNYWNAINLKAIWQLLPDILFLYLMLNATAIVPFVYLEKRTKATIGKFCPICGNPLEKFLNYKCPKCGKIKFEKS